MVYLSIIRTITVVNQKQKSMGKIIYGAVEDDWRQDVKERN